MDVTRNGTEYSFDFSKLGRWVDLCDKVGIQYLEISHLYSQWGAAACPKVIAKTDGEEKQIFGWDTPSDGDEYKAFLSALIPAMLCGRIVWGIVRVLLSGVSGSAFTWAAFMAGAFTNAIPGIIVQLLLLPVLFSALKHVLPRSGQ